MSHFTEIELQHCKDFISKLYAHPLSASYRKPVDPERDNAPNYDKIITEPMDLGKIREKLETNQYSKIDELKYDVDLVWKNSMNYIKKKQNILYQIALCMKEKCDKYFKSVPRSKVEEWELELEKANKRLQKHLNLTIPHESLVPRKLEYAIK